MVRIRESAVIDAPVDEVWRILRDFNRHQEWHPAIAESHIENGIAPDVVGAIRAFKLVDGGSLREQLIRLDDRNHELAYCLLEAPLPLFGYVATIRLKPVTDTGRTFWLWESEFNPPPGQKAHLTDLVANGIYRTGMRSLENFLSGRPIAKEAARQVAVTPSGSPPMRQPSLRADASPATGPQPVPTAGKVLRTGAIWMEHYGGPEVLQYRDLDVPSPEPGQVRIRQSFVGVNFIDVYCRTGYFDLLKLPGIPGMEAAGTIESTGQGVTHLSVGERVAYACGPVGAYAGLRTMDSDLVVAIPDMLNDELAAAGLLKGITAGFLLCEVFEVKPGHVAVIHAAAGGVGSLLVQWAASIGAHVIATVSSEEKAAIARSLGATDVVIGRDAGFVDAVRRITNGRGADVIYDAIGRDTFQRSLDALATRGHLVSFGQASGPIGEYDIGALASKSVTLSRPNYGHYTGTRDLMSRQTNRLFQALEQGRLRISYPAIYPLAEAARAHADLESGRTTGSIVLQP